VVKSLTAGIAAVVLLPLPRILLFGTSPAASPATAGVTDVLAWATRYTTPAPSAAAAAAIRLAVRQTGKRRDWARACRLTRSTWPES
jgi:hypothetical protein